MVMNVKRYVISLSTNDAIDVSIFIEKGEPIKFALNYRARILGTWYEVYRIDNYHEFLHENRFWQSRKAIPLSDLEKFPISIIIKESIYDIEQNYQRYRLYYMREKI